MKHRKSLVIAASVLTLATGGTVLAATHDNPPLPTKTVATTHQEPTQSVTEETAPVQEQTPTVVATPDGKPVAQQTAPVVQPEVLIVQDKIAAMNAANIAPEDQPIVDSILTRYSGWKYYSATDENITLCLARPVIIERFGNPTDPVTQLKYCDHLAKGKYGGWDNALTFYEANRYL